MTDSLGDFYEDFSAINIALFVNLSTADKLREIKRIHNKYFGDYKYMYFLPQSDIRKLVFYKTDKPPMPPELGIHPAIFTDKFYPQLYKQRCMVQKLDRESREIIKNIDYCYYYGDFLQHKSSYFKKKYRKSLEHDERALIYRYKMMYLKLYKKVRQ